MSWQHETASITWSVPIRRWPGSGPLVVGLHGMGQSDAYLARRLAPLTDAGVHLMLPRGPHPFEMRRLDRIRIGYAWYHYDGDEKRFVASMDRAAEFLFPLIDRRATADVPTVLMGFSQGAYMAYYLALRHPDRFAGVVGVAGRAKHEVLGEYLDAATHVRVLHLHGRDDTIVGVEPCRESIESLRAAGLDARFELVDGGHEISEPMARRIQSWLVEGEGR